MSDIVIRAENLSKRYRIGERENYLTLRDTLTRAVKAPARLFGRTSTNGNGNGDHSHIWALKDVSFEIRQGEIVGIIGRNGAGKSTLLKILSRVTKPTTGHVEVHGRMGSLLEVGTGFHPELTGRENTFLNGAILGMSKKEVALKFDEIVAFAEVEKFIDTPLKHYSTGMQMRLAFAVAAHLDTEILLIDEVLAVGDINFQKKCLQKVGDVAKQGRTILLVSHSMPSVAALCQTGILLDRGAVKLVGPTALVVQGYLSPERFATAGVDLRNHKDRRGSGDVRFVHAGTCDAAGQPCSVFNHGDDIYFEMEVEAPRPSHEMIFSVGIRTIFGVPVLDLQNKDDPTWVPLRVFERVKLQCLLKNCPLYPGTYLVTLWMSPTHYNETDWVVDVLQFRVEPGPLIARGFDMTWQHGLVHLASSWRASQAQQEEQSHGMPRRLFPGNGAKVLSPVSAAHSPTNGAGKSDA